MSQHGLVVRVAPAYYIKMHLAHVSSPAAEVGKKWRERSLSDLRDMELLVMSKYMNKRYSRSSCYDAS